ncbi:immunoglobulin superfamily member 21-like isoform X1 [Cololabis saira]|uniref:immunoglobulin superfamily member 21-like isoform X1 n=1 Tax=Cololabis saira TaxID=129043 RepID=UPI002AD5ADAD|nr:immunoglobulin superfamily member 21-like isoform X1 [Cololabis saira]
MKAPLTLICLVFTLNLAAGYLTVSIDPLPPVVIGDTVILRCSFRTDGSLREVMWFQVIKGGSTKQKIFTYVMNNSSYPPMEDVSRENLVYHSTVRLPEVQMEDDGRYECHVGIRNSRDDLVLASDSIILTVIVPPKSISLEAASSRALFSRYEVQNFTLVCKVAGAKPAPVVYFKRDGELIDVLPKTKFSSAGLQNQGSSLDRNRNQAALMSSKVPTRRELDDTKLKKDRRPTSGSQKGPDGLQQGLQNQQDHQNQDPSESTPEPPPEVVPETVVSREFPHWVQSSDPLYHLQVQQQEVQDGTVEVRALLTWSLNPQLDNQALFSCQVSHPGLSMPMGAEVTLAAPRGPKLSMTPSTVKVGDTVRIVVQGFQLGPSAGGSVQFRTQPMCVAERGVSGSRVHLDQGGGAAAGREEPPRWQGAGSGAGSCRAERVHVPLHGPEPPGLHGHPHPPRRVRKPPAEERKAVSCSHQRREPPASVHLHLHDAAAAHL